MIAIVIGVFFLLTVAVPVGVAFALPTILGAPALGIPADTFAASVPHETATSFTLVAIPYFILAGQVMQSGGLMDRLITLAHSALGWLKGALGYVTIAASAMLGAITGSSVATVATMGSTVGRSMIEQGYDRSYVGALTGVCGLLGVLIPPSIPLIIYASVSGVSVGDLFIATMIPGLVMMLAFMLTHRLLLARVALVSTGSLGFSGSSYEEPVERTPFGAAFLRALPALLMPVILLGGIYSGIMTPTESAAAAGLYGLLVALVFRTMRWSGIPRIFYAAGLPSIAILGIIVFSSVFSRAITLERIPQAIAEQALAITENPIVFLLLVNAVLLLVGMFMETNAAVLLMAPLFVPAAMAYGVDPLHFGIILVTNIELGLITPPMAANLYVAAKVNGSSIVGMLKWVVPFFLTAVAVQGLITYAPILTTWHAN